MGRGEDGVKDQNFYFYQAKYYSTWFENSDFLPQVENNKHLYSFMFRSWF